MSKVVIEIIGGTGGNGTKKTVPKQDSSSIDKINDSLDNMDSAGGGKDFEGGMNALVASKAVAQQAANVVKKIVNSTTVQTAIWGIEKQLSLKEDYLGENTLNQIKGNISAFKQYASGMYEGAQAGAKLGKSFGPVGAAIGAGIGAVGGASYTKWKTDVEWRKKQMEYQQKLNETNLQTSFQASRMGLVDGSQGTLN